MSMADSLAQQTPFSMEEALLYFTMGELCREAFQDSNKLSWLDSPSAKAPNSSTEARKLNPLMVH
jgi:hypothetical protein